MKTHLELSMERDIDRICSKIAEMALIVDQALEDCIKAITDNSTSINYAVILRDQKVNEKEMEIDRLCLEFLVRQQPVALQLRFAYSTIKTNLEIERVGDYAESIARQLLLIKEPIDVELKTKIVEIGRLAVDFFKDAAKSFIEQNIELAKKSISREDIADTLRCVLDEEIAKKFLDNHISYNLHACLITIVRRFERVCDQASNICNETIYMCSGEYSKHPGTEFFRVLFIDKHNTGLSLMAEAIAQEQKQLKFIFNSAGIDTGNINPVLVEFMKKKGIDFTAYSPKTISKILHIDHYQILIILDKDAARSLPQQSRKAVFLDWKLDDPFDNSLSDREKEEILKKNYDFLKVRINELVSALNGTQSQ
jgi:phosphate transport system protein